VTPTPETKTFPARPVRSDRLPSPDASFIERIGIPPALKWGFVGLLVFMIGDGVELGYLSPYLRSEGFSGGQVAALFTLYGITVAISSWLSGPLSKSFGARRVMWAGVVIWGVLQVAFLYWGVARLDYKVMMFTYALRGFGYPLFTYSFLVWIANATPPRRLGMAVSWFWVAYATGLPTLGSLVASFAIPVVGTMGTLWLSLALVAAGGTLGLVALGKAEGGDATAESHESPMSALKDSVAIMWHEPLTTLGGLVRTINTASMFGFFIVLPGFFTKTIGFSLEEWLRLLTLIYVGNLVGNLLAGIVGEKIGLRNAIMLMGSVGSTIGVLLLYYVPLMFPGNFAIATLVGVFYGVMLAGFVPLSALMPMAVPHNKPGALAVLSLGAGASTWVGPAVVASVLPFFGVTGVIWAFALLYLLSAFMMMKIPEPKVAH